MITALCRAFDYHFINWSISVPCSHHIRLLLPRTGWVLTRPPRPSFTLNIQLLRVYVWVSLLIGSSVFNVSYRVFPVGCWRDDMWLLEIVDLSICSSEYTFSCIFRTHSYGQIEEVCYAFINSRVCCPASPEPTRCLTRSALICAWFHHCLWFSFTNYHPCWGLAKLSGTERITASSKRPSVCPLWDTYSFTWVQGMMWLLSHLL